MKAQSTMQIWKVPFLLGAMSLLGLVVALVADGFGDLVSWVALGIPTLLGCWFTLVGRDP